MGAKHTPGPWNFDGERRITGPIGISVAYSCEGFSCHGGSGSYRIGYKEAKANANLIAAAPDLLAACKMALEESEYECVRVELRAAIAKAEPV